MTLVLGGAASGAVGAQPASLEARIRMVEDRQAIERVLMEYGRSLDRRDFTTYSSLFARDGVWDGGMGVFRGPAAIKAAMEKTFATAPGIPKGTNFHVLTNAIIDLDGDRATALSKWVFMQVVDGRSQIAMTGSYEDQFVREHGAWKILLRKAPADAPPPAAPAK
jgi:ketosteroid isomerase-like protein